MADFVIHKTAVKLEQVLYEVLQKTEPQIDITRIYDAPLQVCNEVILEVQTNENVQTIQQIKQKYWPYHHYILSQLDHQVCEDLCADLYELR